MSTTVLAKSIRDAKTKLDKVKTIANNDGKYFIEYYSSSDKETRLMSFRRDASGLYVEHWCDARKGDKSCWHLGLIGWIYGLTSAFECEVENKYPKDVEATSDVTQDLLGRPGEFNIVTLITEDETEAKAKPKDKPKPKPDKYNKYALPEKVFEKVKNFAARQDARLTDEQKSRIPKDVQYFPQDNEVLYGTAALLYDVWAPPLFIGPAGSGKSTLAEALAELLHLPLRKISGGIDVNAEYLLGSKTLQYTTPEDHTDADRELLLAKLRFAQATSKSPVSKEQFDAVENIFRNSAEQTPVMQVVHEPGVLLQAVQDGEMILVDEINMLIPEVTSLLHSLLDWQRCITVPGIGEVKAHPDFRLIAAMNVGYMGTRPLNKALRDRFRGIQVKALTREMLEELLAAKEIDDLAIEQLCAVYSKLYDAVYSPIGATLTESCISLRALLRAVEEYKMGIGSLKEVTISCLSESLESESERTQVKDLVEMNMR